VEVALVLPLFGLGLFTALQLIVYCRNMVELQRMASVEVDRLDVSRPRMGRQYHWFHALEGQTSGITVHNVRDTQMRWVPNEAVAKTQDRGHVVHSELTTRLFPTRGFRRALPIVTQSATAVTLLEPAIPEER
jgi:hypothetical protein